MTNQIDAISQIEEAYEYMLAYAAQGRTTEGAGPGGASIRDFLTNFLKGAKILETWVENTGAIVPEVKDEYRKASSLIIGVISMMLEKDNISSEMVDNANALMATRHYLTLVFFLDKMYLES
jgi:hypothetical protein